MVGAAAKGDEYPSLAGPNGVDTLVSGDSTYALVVGKGGVQLIDVSVPSSPVGREECGRWTGRLSYKKICDRLLYVTTIYCGRASGLSKLPPSPTTNQRACIGRDRHTQQAAVAVEQSAT